MRSRSQRCPQRSCTRFRGSAVKASGLPRPPRPEDPPQRSPGSCGLRRIWPTGRRTRCRSASSSAPRWPARSSSARVPDRGRADGAPRRGPVRPRPGDPAGGLRRERHGRAPRQPRPDRAGPRRPGGAAQRRTRRGLSAHTAEGRLPGGETALGRAGGQATERRRVISIPTIVETTTQPAITSDRRRRRPVLRRRDDRGRRVELLRDRRLDRAHRPAGRPSRVR